MQAIGSNMDDTKRNDCENENDEEEYAPEHDEFFSQIIRQDEKAFIRKEHAKKEKKILR